MPNAAEILRAELGGEPKAKPVSAKRAARPSGDFDLFGSANAADPIVVLDRLGIEHSETARGTMAKCPGCGEEGALLGEHGGLKCLHDRCSAAGPPGFPGYRTNVDLVAHAQQIEPADAAKLICEWSGIVVPKNTKSASGFVDDYEYDQLDTYDESSETEQAADEQTPPATTPTPHQLRKLGDILEPALARAEMRRTGDERPVPVPFPQYAEILQGGYWPGTHNIVSSTGAGKSAMAFQTATHAAQVGVPVLYIGLELGEMQVGLRAIAEASHTSWSRMYTGRCSAKDLDRAREAIPALANLPFYVEFGSAHGWAPSNLVTRAEQIRKVHPTGPMLVVLDFLQLVGSEPGEPGRQPDLREKIARAAYCGVHIANKYGASVLLISSVARDKYGLSNAVKEAALTTCSIPGTFEPVRTMLNPDALIGVGKESGEIEYAAESQTVLARWPAKLDNGQTAVIVAVPKLRYGPPSWVAMSFWQRFEELPFKSIDDLPEIAGRGGKGKAVEPDELTARILETVRNHPGMRSQNDVTKKTTGNREKVAELFKTLLASGQVVSGSSGFEIPEVRNQ